MSIDGGGLVGGMSRGAPGDRILTRDETGTVAWSADVCSVWVVVEVGKFAYKLHRRLSILYQHISCTIKVKD